MRKTRPIRTLLLWETLSIHRLIHDSLCDCQVVGKVKEVMVGHGLISSVSELIGLGRGLTMAVKLNEILLPVVQCHI